MIKWNKSLPPLLMAFVVLASCTGATPEKSPEVSIPISIEGQLSPKANAAEPEMLDLFIEPAAPVVGGQLLPEVDPLLSGDIPLEEFDCDNAEELCELGKSDCDDIADYCDYGPDDGQDLPDEFDWDE